MVRKIMTKPNVAFPLRSHLSDKYLKTVELKNKAAITKFEEWLKLSALNIAGQLEEKGEAKVFQENGIGLPDEVERFVTVARDFFRALDYKFESNSIPENYVTEGHHLFTISLF